MSSPVTHLESSLHVSSVDGSCLGPVPLGHVGFFDAHPDSLSALNCRKP